MIDYQLDKDEVLLGELECMTTTTSSKATCNEVAYTNKNIILVYKGLFGRIKEIKKFPIGEIKIFENKAAIRFEQKLIGDSTIDITLNSDRIQMQVELSEKKKAKEMVNQLNKFVAGSNEKIVHNAIPGIEIVAESLKGTFDVIKKTFMGEPKKIETKCKACGASIEGFKGDSACCQYCGTLNEL